LYLPHQTARQTPTEPQELLGLPAEEATALAAKYIDLWGFKNTYAMGKHLAEKAVVRLAGELRLPLAVVRPSLVSAVAAEPYCGYAGAAPGRLPAARRSASPICHGRGPAGPSLPPTSLPYGPRPWRAAPRSRPQRPNRPTSPQSNRPK
jgi:hypothetical protein